MVLSRPRWIVCPINSLHVSVLCTVIILKIADFSVWCYNTMKFKGFVLNAPMIHRSNCRILYDNPLFCQQIDDFRGNVVGLVLQANYGIIPGVVELQPLQHN
jgi:hypothetical protein